MEPEFVGFPKEMQVFFRDLASNNSKEWFEANRNRYERYVLEPSRSFVVAIGEKLRPIVPGIQAIPIANKSLFRINRDIRFSKDKTPYKTHMGLYVWEGDRPKRMECSGFYIHYDDGKVFLGGGLHDFPKDILKGYREQVANKTNAKELKKIIDTVSQHPEITVGGEHYKRPPSGYEVVPENETLLKYKGLFASLEPNLPDSFYKPEFLDFCFERYKVMLPLHRWIVDNLF